MAPRNGLFVKWALALLSTGLLGLGAWGGRTLIADGGRITTLEAIHTEMRGQLNRIEDKLDRLSERR